MTLDRLQQIREQLNVQYQTHVAQTPPEGQTMTNIFVGAIEILAAIRLIETLMREEYTASMAPPGATGPAL